MGVDYRVIWAADFDNDIRFNVRRTARRLSVTRRPPIHQYTKEMTDVSFFCIDVGVIRATDFNNAIKFHVCGPACRLRVTRRPSSHQNIKKTTDNRYGCRFWGYLGR